MSIQCHKCYDTGEYTEESSCKAAGWSSYSRRPCECRRKLERRHGAVDHWDTEVVETIEYEISPIETVTFVISRELPLTADNQPLHRTEDNSHFQTLAQIQCDLHPGITADQLRELAAKILEVAAMVEGHDKEEIVPAAPTLDDPIGGP